MTQEQHRKLDIAVKIGGFFGVILTVVIGLYQFHDLREREIGQFADLKEREFYSELWRERLNLYLKTLDAAARISTASSLDESKEARAEFRTLFDGSMAVVQDPVVDRAIHEFASALDEVEAGSLTHKELGIHSYQLGRICYSSLEDSWNKSFGGSSDHSEGSGTE